MALATQCPYCHTCFRVANDQLKLHAGIVRCGSCQQTFNGIAQLLSPEQTQDLMDGKTPIPKEEKRPIPQETSATPADLVSTHSASTTDTKTEITSPAPKSEPLLESKANTVASNINTNASANEEAHKSAPPISERNAENAESSRLENIPTERKVEEAIEVKAAAISVAKSADTTSIERTPTPANPVLANPAPVSPAPQVWQARPTKNEAPVDSNINHVNNVSNLPSASIPAEVKTDITATGSHVDLDFEIDPPASTSPSFSSFDLDFEIDLPTPPKASTKPSSNDFDFEVEEPTKLVIDRVEKIEETQPAAIAAVASATHTNQEPNFSTDEFLALKEASAQRIAGKNPEPILNSEPVSIPDELDKLDATLDSTLEANLGTTLGATLGAKSEETSDAQLDALNDSTADDKPNFILHAERLEKRKRWRLLSYLLCFILCITALAQATYFFRNDIVAHYPSSKPHLQKACVLLHCSIQMPAQKEAFIFLADELITLSEEKKLFQLAVQLQNNSSTVQQWPHLLLTLNDQQGKPLLKRTFTPKEYLSDTKELQQGFAARTDIAIKLHFELKTINASNYRVEVIYL
jgi:predicted Zn finger-like uncharacterized protein